MKQSLQLIVWEKAKSRVLNRKRLTSVHILFAYSSSICFNGVAAQGLFKCPLLVPTLEDQRNGSIISPTLEEQRNGSIFSPYPWGTEEWFHLLSPPLRIRGMAPPLVPALKEQRNGSIFSPQPLRNRGMAPPLVPALEEQRNGSTFSPRPWGTEEWLHL